MVSTIGIHRKIGSCVLKAHGSLHRPYRTQWLPFPCPGVEKPQAVSHSRVTAKKSKKVPLKNHRASDLCCSRHLHLGTN